MRRGRRTAKAPPQNPFVFEALEPRLLLSADLNAAAGQVFLDGLGALDHSLQSLASSTALSTPVAFVNRSVGDIAGLTQFAGLGDPIAAIRGAAADYFAAHPTGSNLTGLQGALAGLQGAGHPGVTVAASLPGGANPNLQSLDLTIASTSTDVKSPGATDAATQTLHLVFGVDATNAAFELSTATIGSQNAFTGAANGVVDFSETWTATAAAPIVYSATHDGIGAAAVTPDLSIAPAGGAPALKSAASPPPATILPQTISQTFNDFATEINNIETEIENAVNLNFDFPFIGNKLPDALNPHVLMAPIRNEIQSIENTVNSDFANSGNLLKTLQSDIVSALSGAHLLPGATPANDVIIKYQTTDAPGTLDVSTSPNFSLEHVTALRLAEIPIGRFILTEDLANLVLFLCSGAASAITGQAIAVDGGSGRAISY